MKSPLARFERPADWLKVSLVVALGAILVVGVVGALTTMTSDSAETTMGTAAKGSIDEPGAGGAGSGSGSDRSGAASGSGGDGSGSGVGGSGSGVGGSGSGGGEPGSGSGSGSGSGDGGSGSGGGATSPSTTGMRTVTISMVVQRGRGSFSGVPDQPFRAVCQPDGIRREHEGGEPLWEEESGTVEFGKPLVKTFEVAADRQVWCAFHLQPHARWERVTDVSTVVNGSSHAATNVECLMPAPGQSYRRTVEASQYLPGRSDGCEVAFTIAH